MTASDEAGQLRSLIAALQRSFADPGGADDAARAEIRRVEALLASAPTEAAVLQPTHHPLTRHLPAVLDLISTSR